MKLSRRTFLRLAASTAVVPAAAGLAIAQSYPTRPVTMNVPFAAGGPTDAVAPIVAEGMRASLGQAVIIEDVEQQTPQALGAYQKAEIEKWWPIMKAANIRGD